MNRFAHSGRAITAFVLASALYASFAGCSNKTAASANQASPVASPAGSPSGGRAHSIRKRAPRRRTGSHAPTANTASRHSAGSPPEPNH
jgi:hypothetical protein